MYLERGIEEFGENHKPSPFTITCPFCGGWAMDVSGIQKVPGGGYMPLPEGYGYFANTEDRDCGVPTFSAQNDKKLEGKRTEILIADEIDRVSEINKRWQEKEKALRIACLAACAGVEAWEILKAAEILAEMPYYTTEDVTEAIQNVTQALMELNKSCEQEDGNNSLLTGKTAWDRKEDRERRRAAERVNATRFFRQKACETGWRRQKRTRPRRREYRGPDVV